METGNEKEGTAMVQPTSDTPISVYDGGGEHTYEHPSASLADTRPIRRRAYIIRVDHLKPSMPFSKISTPSSVYDGGGGHALGALMDTGEEKERLRVVQLTSDSVFDGGGTPTYEGPSALGADSQPLQTCTVRLNDMRHINNLLKERRDRLNVDKLKLCSGATQSEEDDVANE